MKKKTIKIPFTTESVNDSQNTIEFVMSTNDIDREGEMVEQNWDLTGFKDNPVVLNSHNYDDASEAIGKVVSLEQKDNSLEGKVKFAVDENPKAKTIYELYKGGFLNAVSVGFRELESGVKELLELSSVTVPANAMATAKSKGIDISPLEEATQQETKEGIKKMYKTKIINQARTPKYDGTEESSWGDVSKTMEAFLDAYPGDTEDVNSVDDMTSEMKTWIAQRTLLGDPDAGNFSELAFFPVVNPNTGNLNKGALEAVRGGRGQGADIPADAYDSADQKAKDLLEEEFDVEYDEEGAEPDKVKAGRVLSSANRSKVEKAVEALQAVLEVDAESRDVGDEETKEEEPVKEALKQLHKEIDKRKKDSNRREAHKALRELNL